MLLPILIIKPNVKKFLNHPSDLTIKQGYIGWLGNFIHTTTAKFVLVSGIATTTTKIQALLKWFPENFDENLTEKYSYVFACYKPKNQNFFREMDGDEQDAFLQEIKSDYREILIHYFTTDKTLKEKIDKFINAVFYANIPVPQIIEIHMEVIDEFSKQLRLEGRSDETLLDYRLTLIDILAHLCEIYRCAFYK
ncbi:MAG: KaiA family protein [Gloeotrichia echinulata GP01]